MQIDNQILTAVSVAIIFFTLGRMSKEYIIKRRDGEDVVDDADDDGKDCSGCYYGNSNETPLVKM